MNRLEGKLCAVISGGERDSFAGISEADFIVAADRGYLYAQECAITPNLVIGDFDSYTGDPDSSMLDSEKIRRAEAALPRPDILRLPKEKDDSDTLAALRHCLNLGYRRFAIYCALGGRLDHLISNLQACAFAAEQGADIEVISETDHIYYLHNTSAIFPARQGYSLSVFSITNTAKGVTIKGAAYELTNATLHNTFPIGLSNEWKDGKDVTISVERGTLIVVNSRLDDSRALFQ